MQTQWRMILERWQTRLTNAPLLDKIIRTVGYLGSMCVGLLVMLGPFSIKITLGVLAVWFVSGYALRCTWASRS